MQLRKVTGAQVISATAFANVSGMSLSIAANGVYQVQGMVLWTTSIVTGTRFGFTFPTAVSTGNLTGRCATSLFGAGAVNYTSANMAVGNIAAAGFSTTATTLISTVGGASAATYNLIVDALFTNGANAGTMQLQASQSAAGGGVQILAGSFLRAYKIG